MENKITVKTLYTQYSEITVEKDCQNCKDWMFIGKAKGHPYCPECKGAGKITKKHIVPNQGWRPLNFWIEKFKKEE